MRKHMRSAARVAALLVGLVCLCAAPASAQNAHERAKAAVANGDYASAATLYDEALKASPKDQEILLEAGDVSMELERYGAARDLYRRAMDVDRNAASTRKYASALSALNNHTEAIELLQKEVKDDATLENYLALGQAYLAAGRDSLSKAELTFQTASRKYPKSAEVAVALGDLYYAREVYELAVLKYEEALGIDPTLIEPRIRLGRCYREQARREDSDSVSNMLYNKALLEFNRVTATAPRQPRPWLEQGQIFMLAHLYEKAGRSFEEYVALRPDDARGDIMLARAAYEGNYYNQAIAPLERIVAKNDSISAQFKDRARVMLGKSYYAIKEYVKSREAYGAANDSVFDVDARKRYSSSLLLSNGDTLRAVDMYRKLVNDNPTDCELSMSLGSLLYSAKRYEDVIEVFTKRIADCPEASKATPYLYIGLSYFTRGKLDDAAAALNNSIAADSTSAQAYYWLMNVYAKKEQYGKAAELARAMTARGMDKTNPKEVGNGFFFGGVERFKAKDYRGAIAEFERVLKLTPENAQAHLYMAFSYQSQNDKENACKSYRMVLKYDPKNAEALKNSKLISCQ